jgi:4-aminobutyrate aminotransferase/diaminobutyrate-pyruvate transaminase/4-aminobutyrate aminotransferase/(S)-3-amino-2-methylpropionate transaminase
MAKQFNLEPRNVAPVSTQYRRIATEIPPRASLSMLRQLRANEPVSMSGQPPVVWKSARNTSIYDPYGNMWLDFSSGVVVANSGHGNPDVIAAMRKQLDESMLHSYCFPNLPRAELVELIAESCPAPLKKVFLLSTGSEAAEAAIKLSRTYGKTKHPDKIQIVTFDDGFHGRTLGSLMAGGTPATKKWVTNLDPDMIQVPFPNAFKYDWADESNPDYSDEKCFEMFLRYLKERGGQVDRIAAIMGETFQGGWVQLMPKGFAQRLRRFTEENDIVLVFDEIQAGWGRTGRRFGFDHYGIVPDIALFGKGLSGSMPISAVVGREDIMNLYGPNAMTSTHSGNPIASAAAIGNIRSILRNELPQKALALGEKVVRPTLRRLKEEFPQIGFFAGSGMAWGVVFVKPGTKEIDPDFAHNIVEKAFEKGLLFFAPVGAGATIKITPPLTIEEAALREGLTVFEEAIRDALA